MSVFEGKADIPVDRALIGENTENRRIVGDGRRLRRLSHLENSSECCDCDPRGRTSEWDRRKRSLPGWVKTDMGGRNADRDVAQGADTPVWLALDAPQRLTGKFVRDREVIPW